MKIFIGVDVSKGYADVQFLNKAGTFLSEGSVFDDTAAGHRLLLDCITALNKKNPDVGFVVGLEASGGLERNWEKFFRKLKSGFDMEVLLLNPLAVRKHLERNLRRNKTDKISARNIADYLASGRRRQDIEYERDLLGSRGLYRCISSATGRRVQAQCELQTLLPQVQPELVRYCRDGLPEWILELLIAYPTADRLAKARVKTVAKIKYITAERAALLIASVKQSVASLSDEATATAIVFLVKEIQEQNKKIAELQKVLTDSLKHDRDVKVMDSVLGIGLWTAIVLRLEYGNLERFHSAAAAVAYAGLDPRIDESGDTKRNIGISRAGRIQIRSALFMPTLAAIRSNPAIRDFYQRLLAAGKEKKVAIVACMRKLIHIIYACVLSGKLFDRNYHQQTKQAPKAASGMQSLPQIAHSMKLDVALAAPVSKKEAKRRKAAPLPQKDAYPLMRDLAPLLKINSKKYSG
jgi:transposase